MTTVTEDRLDRRQPIYLLADSQLLFWKTAGGTPFLASVLQYLDGRTAKAAYLGAANGDLPELYALFLAAMSEIGISDCRHIPAALSNDAAAFLAAADLILLAGGNPVLGLRVLQANGVADLVVQRYHAGCVLLGVSAGAVQLGRHVIVESQESAAELLPGLALIPYILDAHQEAGDWSRLSRTVQTLDGAETGLGIPTGGGLLFHPDGTLEPVRTWSHEFTLGHGQLHHRMLLPRE